MDSILQPIYLYTDSFPVDTCIDPEALRNRHPSYIAEAIETRESIPVKIIETLLMERNVISVNYDMEVEKVSALISKYDFLTVPVVDAENRLLGIITVDDVIDIMEAENTEDFHRIPAVVPFEENYFKRPPTRLFWDRRLFTKPEYIAGVYRPHRKNFLSNF